MRRHLLISVLAAAVLASLLVVAIAAAGTFTLRLVKSVHVDNASNAMFAVKAVNKTEAVAVGPAGYAVYTFQGETTHHIICKKSAGCWKFWPPVSPKSAHVTKQSRIHGKLGTFRNHGVLQLTLNGQPVYYFQPDIMSGDRREATGDELKTFGSIWHVVAAHGARASGQSAPAPSGGGGGSTSGW